MRLKFRDWIKKNSYVINNEGENNVYPRFITKEMSPFPTNPWYIAKRPVSLHSQQEIFQTYLSDPEKWTPRALAVHYQVSIPRVAAILRTGALAQKMLKEKKPLQMNLAKGMDRMLGARDVGPKLEKYEPVRSHYGGSLIPYFQFGDDLQSLNPKDAASLLLKDPWSNMEKRLNTMAEKMFSDSSLEDNNAKIISQADKIHVSKADFMFVDTSKKNTIIVREKNGALREASKLEEWYKKTAPLEKYVLE